jgi:hypothetical protein
MNLSDLAEQAKRIGGVWVDLKVKGDKVKGIILDFDERDMKFDEEVKYKKGTTIPRREYLFTLQTDETEGPEDDGIRKISLNESGQRAVLIAIREAGVIPTVGGELIIAVVEDKPTERSQATYKAKYTPPAKTINIPIGEADSSHTLKSDALDELF